MLPQGKSVCIVGAGPSGLVAAKTLTHNHPKGTFHVTIFEQAGRIGGLWPFCKKETKRLNPFMCTNQSRHTVCFSDLAWTPGTPQFPKAYQVGDYLLKYLQKYPCKDIRLNTKVTNTVLESNGTWTVYVDELFPVGEKDLKYTFDYLLLANGFFSNPRIPAVLEDHAICETLEGRIQHSFLFRDVNHLLTNGGLVKPGAGRKIYVIGGQMSGVEVATSVAFQLSSAASSPGDCKIPNASEYTVHHIIQHPCWIVPLFFPHDPIYKVKAKDGEEVEKKNSAPTFLPLDLVSYNLGWRPEGPVANTSGHILKEYADRPHKFMNTWLGSDQSELGEQSLVITEELRTKPAYLAVSDGYTEYVRSGSIKVSTGKIKSDNMGGSTIIIEYGSNQTVLNDIAGIVLATGFEAVSAISFLDKTVLPRLEYDERCVELPLALNLHSTIHHKIPTLGFVGFYRSPYWGVMEMQARFLGKLWSGDEGATEALQDDETLGDMLSLRDDPRRAQFPMGDYLYLMESFREILDFTRLDENGVRDPKASRTGIVVPFRYSPEDSSEDQKEEVSKGLKAVVDVFRRSSSEGKFVARAIFRALQGDWKLERVIRSKDNFNPSGTFSGTGKFLPREPTDKDFDMEYLFVEDGQFKSDTGFGFIAKRSYVYRYREDKDKLSVWFSKHDRSVDYFFHELDMVIPKQKNTETHRTEPWRAKSSHLCIDDMYNVEYQFWFRGVQLREWTMAFDVKGPKKDYRITNIFRR